MGKLKSKRKQKEEPTEFDWEVVPTDRGAGMVCPRCDGKLIVNIDELREMRRDIGFRSVICPYCDCLSLLPMKD